MGRSKTKLTASEMSDRQRLEAIVDHARSAAADLREIRDRRLYRGTHATFESYCQSRGYDLEFLQIFLEEGCD